ncbi:diguanylate cyclase [Bacillus sp. SL00103]
MTNIFNRSSFIERTQILEEDAQDTAVMLFDIDFFKQINDTHGHHIGDEAPRHVVTICQQKIYRWTIYSDDMAEKSLLFVCRIILLKRPVISQSKLDIRLR